MNAPRCPRCLETVSRRHAGLCPTCAAELMPHKVKRRYTVGAGSLSAYRYGRITGGMYAGQSGWIVGVTYKRRDLPSDLSPRITVKDTAVLVSVMLANRDKDGKRPIVAVRPEHVFIDGLLSAVEYLNDLRRTPAPEAPDLDALAADLRQRLTNDEIQALCARLGGLAS